MKFFRTCAALALLLISVGCAAAPKKPAACPFCDNSQQPATMPSGSSIFSLAGDWQTDDGRTIKLSDLRDKTVVMAMFFVSCEGTCSLTVSHLQELEASLPADVRDRVRFVLVTFDPTSDTAAELAQYRIDHHLSQHWTLLRGSDAATVDLAAALGVRYNRDIIRRIAHTSMIVVLDHSGHIRSQQDARRPNLSDSLTAAQAVAKAE
jgi:protein SCO1/2